MYCLELQSRLRNASTLNLHISLLAPCEIIFLSLFLLSFSLFLVSYFHGKAYTRLNPLMVFIACNFRLNFNAEFDHRVQFQSKLPEFSLLPIFFRLEVPLKMTHKVLLPSL